MTTFVNPFWSQDVWTRIDDGVKDSMKDIRVAQRVFQTWPLPKLTSVPADTFDPDTMSIIEGEMIPYVELVVEFPLTNGQVNDESGGLTACTLSRFAARSLALAEDIIILRGRDKELPQGVRIESGEKTIGAGLLGLAHERKITVRPPDPHYPTNSGAEILKAIAEGIKLLDDEQQARPYALIEGTNAWAATWGSVISGDPAYCILDQQKVLGRGLYGTPAMPPDTGLLIALGSDTTTIYIGADPVTEFTHRDGAGKYFFRTSERIQPVARDRRAFVQLDFSYLSPARHEQENNEAARQRAEATGRQYPAKPKADG